jgi:2-amino-4-hydroxy-6-hydroxymethyldihydropteridine diphosphokinase
VRSAARSALARRPAKNDKEPRRSVLGVEAVGVEYSEWAPHYRGIAAQFAFPFEAEEAAAYELIGLLPVEAREAPAERLRSRIDGRTAIVVGYAPGAGAPPLGRLPAEPRRPVLIAADGAADRCLQAEIVPDVVVTDLDGPVPAEVTANVRGALVVIHAHGDNRPRLRTWVPQFPGALAGSWAGSPRAGLINFGGFTDGDRAVFLAEALGAERILLFGFAFDRVEESDPALAERKRAKLRRGRELIDLVARRGRCPIVRWGADGAQEPWAPQEATGADVPSGPSTQ